jgi:hypothetical protein
LRCEQLLARCRCCYLLPIFKKNTHKNSWGCRTQVGSSTFSCRCNSSRLL